MFVALFFLLGSEMSTNLASFSLSFSLSALANITILCCFSPAPSEIGVISIIGLYNRVCFFP
jgi:hypothetical protein